MCFRIIFFCCSFRVTIVLASQAWRWEKNKEEYNAGQLSWRLFNAMESYYEEGGKRVKELDNIRFAVEQTMGYETGYVMHETIERYKKMVELLNRMEKFKSDTLYDHIDKTELIQKLYFEIYHLVNMIHEIPRKWEERIKPVSQKLEKPRQDLPFDDAVKDTEERKKRDRKRKRALLKKRRELIKKGLLDPNHREDPKKVPYNVIWPIDYGWEIEGWN